MFHSSEQESLWKSWDLLVGKQVQKGGIVEIGDLTWFNQWKGRLETFWWFFLDIPNWKKQESSTLKSAGCFPSNVLHPYHSCPCWSAQLFEHPTPTAIYSPKRDLAPIEVTSKQLWRPQVKGVRRPMHRELLLFGTQTSMTSKYKLCKFDLCQSCTETKFVRIFFSCSWLCHDELWVWSFQSSISIQYLQKWKVERTMWRPKLWRKEREHILAIQSMQIDEWPQTYYSQDCLSHTTRNTINLTIDGLTCGPWAAQAVSNGVAEPVSEARPWLMAQCTHRNSKNGDVLKQSQTCKHLG